jgi:hydroxymethylpyrimidine/phosphomethylpyrimidine kinase
MSESKGHGAGCGCATAIAAAGLAGGDQCSFSNHKQARITHAHIVLSSKL